jgi:hypothetical protein
MSKTILLLAAAVLVALALAGAALQLVRGQRPILVARA